MTNEKVVKDLCRELYGFDSMTFQEELALPEAKKRTMNNKIQIVNDCYLMYKSIDQIQWIAKCAPLLDDPDHAELVDKWARIIRKTRDELARVVHYEVRP